MATKQPVLRGKPPRRTDGRNVTRKPASAPAAIEHDDSAGVDQLMQRLNHPLKGVVASVRSVLLKSHKGVTEGIKWNSPSFWLNGWFATVNLHPKRGVLVVLHQGVRGVPDSAIRESVPDPGSLLTWHSPDRASIAFASAEEYALRAQSLAQIARAWAAEHARLTASRLR